ncbi:MAG: hypothetical protein Q9222_007050, partial [Ikaeria aurantiellina]
MPSFTSLAEEALASARQLDEYLASKNLPPSSFETDTLTDLPPDLEIVRTNLIDTSQTLKQLAQGEVGRTVEILFS